MAKEEKKVKKDKKGKKDKKEKKDKEVKSGGGVAHLIRGDRNSIMLTELRISYPKIFSIPMREQDGKMVESKAGCSILFSKSDERHMALVEALQEEIKSVSAEKHDQIPPPQNLALKDGSILTTPDDEHWVLSSYCASGALPRVLAPNKAPIESQADWVSIGGHAGCVCNFSIRFWAQANKHGKRVNCELFGIQFVREDVVLDNSMPASAVDDMFGEIEDTPF